MDKNANAVEQLKTGIKNYIDKKADEIPCDKTFTALVTKVSSNGFYSVSLNGVEYNNIRTIGGTCKVNESVKVLVPQNNYNNMFILKGIEDTGNYKLYEYQNENAIDINEGNTKDRKYYSWVCTKTNNVNVDPSNPSYFYVDNEYYVTDDEEYMNNPICYGYAFIQTYRNPSSLAGNIRYRTIELKHAIAIKGEKCCFFIVKSNTRNNSGKWVRLEGYSSINNMYVYNDDINNNNTTLIESGTFPPTLYMSRADYIPPYGIYASEWGDYGGTEFCCGYISTNIPIFDSQEDASEYYQAETKEERLQYLKKAINYKEKNYKEIFSTSVLMNENSKVKIDVEALMNYNSDSQSLLFPVSQDYGHEYFRLNDAMIKNVVSNATTKHKTATGELLHNFVILLNGDKNYFFNNTNNKICVCLVELNNDRDKYIKLYKRIINGYETTDYVYFYGKDIYYYYINLDGTVEYISETHSDIGSNYDIYMRLQVSASVKSDNFYLNKNAINLKNNIFSAFKNTFIQYYPLYISPSCDNAIYYDNKIVGRFIVDRAIPVKHGEISYKNVAQNALLGKYYDYPKEMNIDLDNLEVQYYVNDELVETRNPRTMLTDGGNILRLMYILSSESGGMNKISIRLCVKKGKLSIDEKGIWVSISGAGLLDQTYWNGDIEIAQDFELINPIDPIIVSYNENINVDIVERPIMRNITWGYLFNSNLSWQNVKDRYIW